MKFYDYLTEFIFVENKPEPADIIFVPGGPYPDSARHAARLYKEGYAPYVMPSGKHSILKDRLELPEELWEELETRAEANMEKSSQTNTLEIDAEKGSQANTLEIDEEKSDQKSIQMLRERIVTESDYLCEVMRQAGVPERALISEDQATYTYENAIYSRKKLDAMGISIKKAILCCQAFHARRSLLYYQEQFPDTEFRVCPVVTRGISRDTWHQSELGIETVLGEVERCGGQFHEIMKRYMI